MGFKWFEGRSWNHEYRGPLWIHSTSKQPDPQLIKEIEKQYKDHYKKVGKNRPPFPDNYPTSTLLGRVDLINILTLDECKDTIPEEIWEKSECAYQFVIWNPQALVITK